MFSPRGTNCGPPAQPSKVKFTDKWNRFVVHNASYDRWVFRGQRYLIQIFLLSVSICLFIYLSICVSLSAYLYLSVHPSVHLSIHRSVYLYLWDLYIEREERGWERENDSYLFIKNSVKVVLLGSDITFHCGNKDNPKNWHRIARNQSSSFISFSLFLYFCLLLSFSVSLSVTLSLCLFCFSFYLPAFFLSLMLHCFLDTNKDFVFLFSSEILYWWLVAYAIIVTNIYNFGYLSFLFLWNLIYFLLLSIFLFTWLINHN